jgi:hypothetical protein
VPHSKLRMLLDAISRVYRAVAVRNSARTSWQLSESSGTQLRRGQLVWQVRPRIVQTQVAASELANQRASLLGT